MSFTGGIPLNALPCWGAADINQANGTRVMPPGWSDSLGTNTPIGFRAPRAGVIRNFTARHNRVNGNGLNVQYAIRKNGVITAASVTIASGAVTSGLSTTQVTVAANDLIECVRVIAANIGNGQVDAVCACEFMGAASPGLISGAF